ncbi:hypothetical protein THL1_1004 [Pseudomonas sp. TCU-HL1]|nr:hypothetical protein THL1_1004 [Pseudomonas sp. TCU-HL1]
MSDFHLLPHSVAIPENRDKQKSGKAFALPLLRTSCEVFYGGSCRIRTYDQLVKSQLLYRLS